MRRNHLFVILLLLAALSSVGRPAWANHVPFQVGDVFVSVSDGKVQHRDAAGKLLEILDTLQGGFTTGMAFDSLGNLYVTNFGAGNVRKFDNRGGLIGTFGSGYSGAPESIVFDKNGNAYVGAVNGDNHIRKFDPTGSPLGQFAVATEDRGTDWIDLAADQCTMLYTSEGLTIKRFNVCSNTQLSNFNAVQLPGPVAYALRILSNDDVLVADTSVVVRLDSSGHPIQQYDSAGHSCWFALNLDPDGASFWSADFCTSTVHKFDIQSGRELLSFSTGTGPLTVFGIAVFGEFTGSRHFLLQSTLGSPGPQSPFAPFAEPVNTGTGNYYYSKTDLRLSGRGMPLAFTRFYNSLDTYSGPLGAGWTHSYNVSLTVTAGGLVIVKEADGHEAFFRPSAGGAYSSQTKGDFDTLVRNGDATFTLVRKNQTVLTFSSAGKLLHATDRNSNTQTFRYDGVGNLAEITDAVGRSLALTYDSSNRVAQITDPAGHTVLFTYDGSGNLTNSTGPAGGTTTYAYDANHRVTSITLPNGQKLLQNGYDVLGRVISQTNGREFTTSFAYGAPNPEDTTITDARGNKTLHTYDASLRIIKITDAMGGTTTFTYDANNDRTSVNNPNGKTTNFAYDSLGNVTDITDPLARRVAFTYDPTNNLLTATNAKGNTTAFSYDASGNLTAVQDALGNKTAFAYDGFGQLTSKTDARGNTTGYSYDASGNLMKITDALGNVTSLNYDGIGRLTSITDPNGHAANATYDALSRLVKIADPLGNATQFTYDPVGNLLKIADANGNATSYGYDATNNLVSVTDAMGHVTRYGYDKNNNRTAFTNAKGNTTSYAFDALNRLASITDPLFFTTLYVYDAAGNVVATTDAKGQTNRFAFDALNRLIAISYANGKSVAYSYDANGNRTTMVDSHGTTAYAYDVLDRLVSATHLGGKVVSYGYDAVGNRSSLSYPDGKNVSYAYDPANRLSQVKDWLGRTTSYGYDAASNLLQVLYPNHAGVSFAYDAANRLTEVQNRFRGSDEEEGDDDRNPLAVFRYALDRVGNRLQVTDGRGRITRYGYDPLYELTSVQKLDEDDAENEESGGSTEEGKITRYTYDAVGNRLSLTGPHHLSIDYAYDADDRLLSAGTSTFTYDANGNQTSKTQTATGQPIVYAYDAANRLISVSGGRINSNFAYDGDGNRVNQSTRAGTFNYLNDVATALPVVLQEFGPDGDISYAYGLSRISESSPEFDFFYQYDGLGSVVGLTDPRGHLRTRYAYDAWGQPVLPNDDDRIGARNAFRFTGEALDLTTQLYYLRARYYDAGVGRFISKDPFAGIVQSPAAYLNRYLYAGNNPGAYPDPSGLSFSSALNNVLDAASDALVLSATTIARGTVDTAAFITGGQFYTKRAQQVFDRAQQVQATALVGSVATLEGVSLSAQEKATTAASVVEITNLASTVLDLFSLAGKPIPNFVQDHNLLTAVHNPFYLFFQQAYDVTSALSGVLDSQQLLVNLTSAGSVSTGQNHIK